VTPRNNKNGINTRISARGSIARINQTLSNNLEPKLAEEELDLDDICSDLSSVPPTPRKEIKEVKPGFWEPSQVANTSSRVESDVTPLERVTLPEVPTEALQATNGDIPRPRVFLGTLVRDVTISATDDPAFSPFLDRQNRTRRHILL